MKVECFPLGELRANCYFLVRGDDCLIVDPGDEADFIVSKLTEKKLHLQGILATHGHFDHVMAVGEIQRSFDVPFYISEKDLFLLKKTKESAEYFLDEHPLILPIKNIKNISAGKFQISNFKFIILNSPGHTPGSVCFYLPAEKIIFTGDTLFKDSIGRYDFSYSSKKDLFNSLKKILKLPAETIIYPGHGEETSIKQEITLYKDLF